MLPHLSRATLASCAFFAAACWADPCTDLHGRNCDTCAYDYFSDRGCVFNEQRGLCQSADLDRALCRRELDGRDVPFTPYCLSYCSAMDSFTMESLYVLGDGTTAGQDPFPRDDENDGDVTLVLLDHWAVHDLVLTNFTAIARGPQGCNAPELARTLIKRTTFEVDRGSIPRSGGGSGDDDEDDWLRTVPHGRFRMQSQSQAPITAETRSTTDSVVTVALYPGRRGFIYTLPASARCLSKADRAHCGWSRVAGNAWQETSARVLCERGFFRWGDHIGVDGQSAVLERAFSSV